jgi:hypothetical protein
MSGFDDREKGFEAKFHLDEELAFKVMARRDRLLGLWVAGHLKLSGAEADAYAAGVVETAIADSHHSALLSKLLNDLAAVKAPVGAPELHAEMARVAALARQQIVDGIVDEPPLS